ncbi:MAG: chromosome segregation protein SMC [Cyanophyceae cyanobacterium]
MVHIKRVELSHFKSFGGTARIPILPGFTVVSGPNGSGKSNILDALLFCLGLATSRGMRAERLPDLVNHNRTNGRRAAETTVSVTFALSDGLETEPFAESDDSSNGHNGSKIASEWTVTRRLRVGQGGNYSSTYYINGAVCTASELHEQLSRLRIYPEGYNVVLQGDVTRIITMNSRERREIIDELAGVAEFDRRIEQAKQTLEDVREREDRCRILEQELIKSRDRLAADRVKAEKYHKLKGKIQEQQQQEKLLIWHSLHQQERQLQGQMTAREQQLAQLTQQLSALDTDINQATAQLAELNRRVKALGEDEQLSVASKLATQKAKHQQLEQRQQERQTLAQQNQEAIARTQGELAHYHHSLSALEQRQSHLQATLPTTAQRREQAQATLQTSREQADAIAAASDAWIQEQAALSRQIATLQKTLNPLQNEQAQLQERTSQRQNQLTEQYQLQQINQQEREANRAESTALSERLAAFEQQIQLLAHQLATAEQECTISQETQTRLLREQREKQRQLDKLEATKEAQQDAQGTTATRTILQANLPGVCGLVAQLGQVEPRYQLALETAAGGRLGFIVVEDDQVAAAGIELLRQRRAGRATFLPLNKIQPPRFNETVVLRYARGFVDLAVNLIDAPLQYRKIFAYVFGGTVVFETIDEARPYLGKQRIVTMAGDLLESSGAMTGGSRPLRSALHFGTATPTDSEELESLRHRLAEIDRILERNERYLAQKNTATRRLAQELTDSRQQGREQQLRREQLDQEEARLTAQQAQLAAQVERSREELRQAEQRLQDLATQIPLMEAQLQQNQQRLSELEASGTSSEWQQLQVLIKEQEAELQQQERAYREVEEQLKDVANQQQRLVEKITEAEQRLAADQNRASALNQQQLEVMQERASLGERIAATEEELARLSERLGETKQERDHTEANLRSHQHQQQQQAWQQQKLIETQQSQQAELAELREEIARQRLELPEPLPEPAIADPDADLTTPLGQLQQELRSAQKRLEAMEPVNMLALEEYEQMQARLEELSAKLATLEAERTEILLRVENFTTLRLQEFKKAFDAVNENFQSIFATLSDGDGYLQLEDTADPFSGGLNLVAHPKGKPVQRLSSMSGGEKSLTALSFIFALQRYRPSPFYAFDEVDMFLDGANVERLSKMIKHQAQQAQFIVVSLRRPMIEAAQRTIGVTQARGAYTQVLGIKL